MQIQEPHVQQINNQQQQADPAHRAEDAGHRPQHQAHHREDEQQLHQEHRHKAGKTPAYKDLRDWLEIVESLGELKKIGGADWNLEMGTLN